MIELYAITDADGPPLPDLVPLRAVRSADLAAVCGEAAEGQPTPERLWAHEEVVEALMERRDLLPVRYGTRLADEHAVARALAERRDQLAESLERVRGAAEVAVRVLRDRETPAEEATVRSQSGTEYLRRRAGQESERAGAVGSVHDPLSAAAREATLRPSRLPDEVLSAAYLIDRDRIKSFTALVASLQERHPELRLICTGPWPPYSFAER